MDNLDPTSLLQQIAEGSLGKVIVKNNKLVLITVDTIKLKNTVLREFVEESIKDGFTYEEIVTILLSIDEAVENNNVQTTLSDYLH